MLFWRLRWGLAGLLGVVVSGTLGYHFIEDWSLFDSFWMVMITLTTIGFGEVHKLSDAGRMFTIALIAGGVSTLTYSLGQITRYVIEGGLIGDLQERRRRRKMKELDNHIIVVGLGRLGREVVAELHHSGCQVIGIDIEQGQLDKCKDLNISILGDGSDDDTLMEAAIERASGVAIATRSSATNVYVTLSARQLNPDLHILTRVDDERAAEKAIRAGADEVINPFGITGARIAQGMLRPHAANFVDLAVGRSFGDLAIEDIRIGDSVEYHGRLAELNIPGKHAVMVIAVRRADGHLHTATDKNTELHEGDVAVVIGKPSDIGTFAVAAGGSEYASIRPGRRM